jgi:N-carbamoyl-L-amino-acid hydrolase
MRSFLARRCADIGRARGVTFDLGRHVTAAPILLDEAGRMAIEAALEKPHSMVSGAGHDAAEFVRRGIPAAMVFVRNRHGSHNPREAMEIADLMRGIDALYAAVQARAR